jgi:hypothetical protein
MKRSCAMILSLMLLGLIGSAVRADRIGYGGIVHLSAETAELSAEHGHDWSEGTHDARWKMISTTRDPFTAENNYSYLQLNDKATKKVLFRVPVPALTYIWISPDSKYVVGLSKIKLWNPYQIVVYSRSGERLFARDLVGANLPGEGESVTNLVIWYKEPTPKIEMIENGSTVTLIVENPLGGSNQFQFNAGK